MTNTDTIEGLAEVKNLLASLETQTGCYLAEVLEYNSEEGQPFVGVGGREHACQCWYLANAGTDGMSVNGTDVVTLSRIETAYDEINEFIARIRAVRSFVHRAAIHVDFGALANTPMENTLRRIMDFDAVLRPLMAVRNILAAATHKANRDDMLTVLRSK